MKDKYFVTAAGVVREILSVYEVERRDEREGIDGCRRKTTRLMHVMFVAATFYPDIGGCNAAFRCPENTILCYVFIKFIHREPLSLGVQLQGMPHLIS